MQRDNSPDSSICVAEVARNSESRWPEFWQAPPHRFESELWRVPLHLWSELWRVPLQLWFGILLFGVSMLVPASLAAQDRITVVNPETGVRNQFQGQVLAWDRLNVTYVTGGRERQIPARRVARIDYPKSPGHEEAERFFEAGRFDQAAQALQNAMQNESRAWVVEAMRARRMQCAQATGDLNQALAGFLEIWRSNPQTRFFHLIPLAWQTGRRARGGLANELEKLLPRDDSVGGLIAASWLLMNDTSAARDRLKQLSISGDSRIAQLASAQLWRPQVIAADAAELRRWQIAIGRMPESLQAGPRYLTAVVQQRLQGDDQAVIAFMQIPVLYPEQYQLAGSALLHARQILVKLDRPDEAELVTRELLQSYGYSTAASRLQHPDEPQDQ